MRFMPMSDSELTLDLFYAPGPSALDYYQVWLASGIGATIRQNWCRAEVSWEQGKVGRPAARLRRKMPRKGIDTHGHKQLRFFGAIATDALLRLTINDETQELRGHDDPEQYTLPIVGERIRRLAFEYVPQSPGVGAATLMWLALVDPERDAQRLTPRGYYEDSWEGFLLSEGQEVEPKVEIGLLFGQEELADLRVKAASPLYKPWMEALRKQARAMLKVRPESLIGEYACAPLHYTRPAEREGLTSFGRIQWLAFVGLLDNDLRMLRHAARWMLSFASCRYWYNDFGGELPGVWWHHRAFMEADISLQCALGLDWAGAALTRSGKEMIRDAIARRGLPRIQQDYVDPHVEEIRHINQGIVFNSGRIMALLALAKEWPRAATRLQEAEDDGREMFGNTFTSDGGTVEGPSYWQYTLGAGLPGVIALARYRCCRPSELLPTKLQRAPGYPPAFTSTARPGQSLAIGDSRGGPICSPDLAAMLTRVFPGPESERLASYILRRSAPGGDIPTVIIFGPRELGDVTQLVPEFAVLEGTGQALVCREMPEVGPVRLQVVGGPVARLTVGGSHSHEDRGNILLEAGGEELLIDRGIGGYSSALGLLLKRPAAHNLLVPDRPDGSPAYQDLSYKSDIVPQASYECGLFRAVIEASAAWPEPVARSRRTVLSSTPDVFEITDELELTQPLGATLHLHTPCQARWEGQAWVFVGKGVELLIEPQWSVAEAQFAEDDFGAGAHGSACGHLQLRAASGKAHHLVTRLTVRKRRG